jgi:hypothetical protein
MRMSELFASGDESPARVMTRRSVGTLETAVRVDTGNYEYFFLCPDIRKKRMIPIYGRLRAKTLAEFGELVRHPGEEFIYVLTGRVEVHTEFYETVTLEPGQCVYLDSAMGHAYLVAPGCDEATLVSGCSSPDEELINLLSKPGHLAKRDAGRSPEIVPAKLPSKLTRPKTRRRDR